MGACPPPQQPMRLGSSETDPDSYPISLSGTGFGTQKVLSICVWKSPERILSSVAQYTACLLFAARLPKLMVIPKLAFNSGPHAPS